MMARRPYFWGHPLFGLDFMPENACFSLIGSKSALLWNKNYLKLSNEPIHTFPVPAEKGTLKIV
jgi:hypothetical protein